MSFSSRYDIVLVVLNVILGVFLLFCLFNPCLDSNVLLVPVGIGTDRIGLRFDCC